MTGEGLSLKGRCEDHPKGDVITDALPQTASTRRFGFRFWWMYVVPAS